MTTQATPATWTIRFRYHKTTVILHVDPLQNVLSIKSELLSALEQSCPNGKLSETLELPSSAAEILLARPADINDPSAGWKQLHLPATDGSEGRGRLGKGKGKAREGSVAQGVEAESLKSLGIKDNAVLAFTVSSAANDTVTKSAVKTRKPVHVDSGAGDDSEGVSMDDEEATDFVFWDVIMPSWEDQYGVVNQGDAGVASGFEG